MSTDTIGLICCIIGSLALTIPIVWISRKRPRGYQPHMKRVVGPVPPQSISASIVYRDDPIKLSGRPSGFGSCVPNPWATTNEETIRRIVREELTKQENK